MKISPGRARKRDALTTAVDISTALEYGGQAMTFQIGERIGGRYEVYGIAGGAGRSGMGTVYICYDHEQRGALALKTYQDGFFRDRTLVDHFKRGALNWIRLDRHPYIVQAHGVFDLAGRLFLGLEYVAPDDAQRNTLTHYLRDAIALERMLRWTIEFIDAMEHARVRGITPHRDIKPDNLMIARDGRLKVTDFDLAGVWRAGGASGGVPAGTATRTPGLSFIEAGPARGVAGTPPWMAPEQFDGEASVQSDLYSFGVVLYQLAARGRLPRTPGTDGDWRRAHATAAVEKLDTPLWPVIERCLARDPSARHGSGVPASGLRDLRADVERLWQELLPACALPQAPAGTTLVAEDHSNKGASLSSLGLHREALREYQQALALKPDHAPAYLNAGAAYAGLGDVDKAAKAYRKAIQLDRALAEAYNNYGLVRKGQGDLKEAEAAFRKAIALKPELLGAWQNLGVLLSEQGRHDESIALMAKAVAGDPGNAAYHYSHGVSLEKAGRHQEALASFAEAVRLRPEDAHYQYGLGNGWRFLGDMENAVACWREAVACDPGFTVAWFNLGIAHERAGQIDAAYDDYRQAVQSNPRMPDAYYNLGLLLGRNRLFGEGADAFEKFLEHLTPELAAHSAQARENVASMRDSEALVQQQEFQYPEGVYNRGHAYLNLGRLDDARRYFERALAMRPGYAPALTGMGVCDERSGQWDEAAVWHQRAIDANADFALAWNNLGWVHYRRGRDAEALAAYTQYLAKAPPEQAQWVEGARQVMNEIRERAAATAENRAPPAAEPAAGDAGPVSQLNECLESFNQGRTDQALAALGTMAAQANSAEAHNLLGEELAARGRYEDALDEYFKALEIDPQHPAALYNIGRAFAGKGDYDAAEGQFRDLVAQFPGDPAYPYHLGETLRLKGSFRDAVLAYDAALELDPGLVPAHCNRGIALDALGRAKDAMQAFRAALRHNPDHAGAHFNLAQILDRQGFAPLAIESYREFMRCAGAGAGAQVERARAAVARLGA